MGIRIERMRRNEDEDEKNRGLWNTKRWRDVETVQRRPRTTPHEKSSWPTTDEGDRPARTTPKKSKGAKNGGRGVVTTICHGAATGSHCNPGLDYTCKNPNHKLRRRMWLVADPYGAATRHRCRAPVLAAADRQAVGAGSRAPSVVLRLGSPLISFELFLHPSSRLFVPAVAPSNRATCRSL